MLIMKKCQRCEEPMIFKGGNHRYCGNCSEKKEKHICANCKKPLVPYKGGNHKYCTICSEIVRKDNTRLRRQKYYRRWKDVLPIPIGTGWLSGHTHTDFKKEQKAVKGELRRFKLKT